MSVESRLVRVEGQVVDLIKTQAALNANVTTLSTNVSALQPAVSELTAALNKARGAVWTGGIVGAVVGSVFTWFMGFFKAH